MTGRVETETIENLGIEEAINEYDAIHIMENMDGERHEPQSYVQLVEMISEIMKDKDFSKAVKSSQMLGSDSWKDILGKENSENLSVSMDKYLQTFYLSFSQIKTAELKEKNLSLPRIENRRTIESIVSTYMSKDKCCGFENELTALINTDEEQAKKYEENITNDKAIESIKEDR